MTAPANKDKYKKYSRSDKGKQSLRNARKAYDERDIERRRAQKRDYMRRWREKQKILDLEGVSEK